MQVKYPGQNLIENDESPAGRCNALTVFDRRHRSSLRAFAVIAR